MRNVHNLAIATSPSRKRKRSHNANGYVRTEYELLFDDVVCLLRGERTFSVKSKRNLTSCRDFLASLNTDDVIKIPRFICFPKCDDPCDRLWHSIEMIAQQKYSHCALSSLCCDSQDMKSENSHPGTDPITTITLRLSRHPDEVDVPLRNRVCLNAIICRLKDSFGISGVRNNLQPRIKVCLSVSLNRTEKKQVLSNFSSRFLIFLFTQKFAAVSQIFGDSLFHKAREGMSIDVFHSAIQLWKEAVQSYPSNTVLYSNIAIALMEIFDVYLTRVDNPPPECAGPSNPDADLAGTLFDVGIPSPQQLYHLWRVAVKYLSQTFTLQVSASACKPIALVTIAQIILKKIALDKVTMDGQGWKWTPKSRKFFLHHAAYCCIMSIRHILGLPVVDKIDIRYLSVLLREGDDWVSEFGPNEHSWPSYVFMESLQCSSTHLSDGQSAFSILGHLCLLLIEEEAKRGEEKDTKSILRWVIESANSFFVACKFAEMESTLKPSDSFVTLDEIDVSEEVEEMERSIYHSMDEEMCGEGMSDMVGVELRGLPKWPAHVSERYFETYLNLTVAFLAGLREFRYVWR
jgi:hypothetical protein